MLLEQGAACSLEKFYQCFTEVNNMNKNYFGYKTTVLIFFIMILNSNLCIARDNNMVTINDQYNLEITGFIPEMLQSKYWIKTLKKPDEIILTKEEIDTFNQNNYSHCKKLVNLEHFKLAWSRDQIQKLIAKTSKKPTKKRYCNGKLLKPAFFDKLHANLNLENIPRIVIPKYAITVRRTEIRSFPTPIRIFSEIDDYEFDRLMETALYPIDPIVILHTSRDGKWFFAQCYNYLAWIPVDDVAIGTKKEIFSMINRKDFLVVTGKKVFTGFNPINSSISELQLDMGVRIPLSKKNEITEQIDGQHPMGNYVVKLPTRNSNGDIKWKSGFINMSDDVHLGYLPYTRKNIIQQAFKFLGQRYGWGGMFNARDCTSFILDIFRTMGLVIPRNSSEQGKLSYGKFHSLPKDLSLDEKISLFKKIPPVTPVYMNGHAMLYLNRIGNDFFIIHDFTNLRTKENGMIKTTRARSVFITPLINTFLSSGKTYLEGLYGAREYR